MDLYKKIDAKEVRTMIGRGLAQFHDDKTNDPEHATFRQKAYRTLRHFKD
jgi:DNA-binding ferritin-like protein (Dps family)